MAENHGDFARFMEFHGKSVNAIVVVVADLELTEAATVAGFCDQAHFTNAIRRHFGTIPRNLLKLKH